MRVARLNIENFRGVAHGAIELGRDNLLVGANGVGKSTVCEALDLVLDAERMFRRPVVDEHDFHRGAYLPVSEGDWPEIRVEVTLADLTDEARRRFAFNLEIWDDTAQVCVVAPVDPAGIEDAQWRVRLLFVGRYNPDEDDFDGGTFFAHPSRPVEEFERDRLRPGAGLQPFTREDKRLCGFLYLRANRTGTRALSFGRGSLLDTIARLEAERAGGTRQPLWAETLDAVASIDLGQSTALASVLEEVTTRARRFVNLSDTQSVRAELSELTREHLREVLRVFIATRPGTYAVPVTRLSTGTVNLLVFALLTYVAELRGNNAVIFAMEEPEIALPPHAQRRLVAHVRANMAQAIVTSHSPYVLDQFAPENIVVLRRNADSILSGHPLTLPDKFAPKRYKKERRQFAEAVLAQAVAVVEGASEIAVFHAVAAALARFDGTYVDPDLDGITFYDAEGDVAVPTYAPIFSGLGKRVYGWHDKLNTVLTTDQAAAAEHFDIYIEHAYEGIEDLLCAEMPPDALRRFAKAIATRSDYPTHCGTPPPGDGAELVDYVRTVLIARKGANDSYAAILVSNAATIEELPATVVAFLRNVHQDVESVLAPAPRPAEDQADEGDTQPGLPSGVAEVDTSTTVDTTAPPAEPTGETAPSIGTETA